MSIGTELFCPHCQGTGRRDGVTDLTISLRLVGERVEAGISTKVLAAQMGFSAQYLNDLERARRRWNPQLVGAYEEALRTIVQRRGRGNR
jgi:ribosome-binding protein aMBF1 (putative translation factor)